MIRLGQRSDLKRIMETTRAAQKGLRMDGVDQWQDGYPEICDFEKDMEEDSLYLVDEGGVLAFAAILEGEDEAFKTLDNWKENTYLTIHRIAVDPSFRGRGLARDIFTFAGVRARDQGLGGLRVDTHRDNMAMRRLVDSLGFEYRGLINSGRKERLAYELVLRSKNEGFSV